MKDYPTCVPGERRDPGISVASVPLFAAPTYTVGTQVQQPCLKDGRKTVVCPYIDVVANLGRSGPAGLRVDDGTLNKGFRDGQR